MTSNTETKILAGTLHNARQLTQFYLNHAKDLDTAKRFTVGEFTTNSIQWLVAHLTWAEDFLILQGVGNKGTGKPWLKHFQIGSEYPDAKDLPSFEEALEAFHEIHKLALEVLNNLDDAVLDEKNHVGLKFGSGDSKRSIISHSIRHEGMHCGHIGWLIRMQGKKVI